MSFFKNQDQIASYRVERLIGKGAMASVYLCCTPTGERVAIKKLDSTHPPILRRFQKEINVLRELEHEGIVSFIDSGVHQDYPYIVMEYIDGIDLKLYTQKLHQRPPVERYARCRDFGIQITQILQYIHNKGIIHRDIKPDNFLIGGTESTRDTIFVIDFGLAKCYMNSAGEHIPYKDGKNLTGTARYASIATHQGKE